MLLDLPIERLLGARERRLWADAVVSQANTISRAHAAINPFRRCVRFFIAWALSR
jgi:hypothetical protein